MRHVRVLVSIACALGLAGPAAGAGWIGGGPEIGWVTDLVFPFGPSGPLLAGTYGGGLWRSHDGGSTWVEATSNARDAIVEEIELGLDAQQSLYLATADRGVLRANFGESFFTAVNTGIDNPAPRSVHGIEFHPGQPLRVSAATSSGIFSSRNRGNVWEDSLAWAQGNFFYDLEVPDARPNTIFAFSTTEVFVSEDYGNTVFVSAEGLPVSTFLFDAAVWPGSADSVVVADRLGLLHLFVDRSRFTAFGPAPDVARQFNAVEFDRAAMPTLLAGADVGVYLRDPSDGTWRRRDGGRPRPEVWAIEAPDASAGDFLLGTFTRGFVAVSGETTWSAQNRGLRAAWVRAVDRRGDEVLVGTAHGRVYRSLDGGRSWTDVTGDLDTLQVTLVALLDDGAWLVSAFDGVHRSADGGGTWTAVGLPTGVTRLNRLVAPVWAPSGRLIAGTDRGVVESQDHGASWTRRLGDLPGDRPVFALAAADTAPVVAVGFDPSPSAPVGALYVGRWSHSLTAVPIGSGFSDLPRGLGFLDPAADTLVVAGIETPFRSPLYRVDDVDGARSVVDLSAGLPLEVLYATGLVVDPSSRQLVLATDLDGVFRSEDGGSTWTEWNEDLATPRVEAIHLAPGSPVQVTVGTLARGAWSRELPRRIPVLARGPWLELTDGAVRLGFELAGPGRARLVRRTVGGWQVLVEVVGPGRFSHDDPVEGLDGPSVTWALEIESGGRWIESARVERALGDLSPPRVTRWIGAAPNPFNPRTTLRWEQAARAEVRVTVHDLRGRRVRALAAEEFGPGRHALTWDGSDESGAEVSSGSYLVRVSVGEREFTGRLTLVR